MTVVELKGEVRRRTGKEAAKKLRRRKLIPAVVYGQGVEPVPIAVSPRNLLKALEAGENAIIKLTLETEDQRPETGGLPSSVSRSSRTVILKELQRHPVRGEILHADFLEISMERKLRVAVPIQIVGEAIGVRAKGGILDQHLRELSVECLPMAIPDRIEVDVSPLDIGDAIHVRDLQGGEGVRILEDPERKVVSVIAPEIEAAAEGAAEVGAVEAAPKEVKEA